MEMSSLRIFEVMAMIGVESNCLTKWQAETPSRLGIMMSIKIMSYFDPAFNLFTASNPSSLKPLVISYDASGHVINSPRCRLSS